MMYVITGATGNTGKKIAEALLKAGKKVKVISRSADHLKGLIELGAEPAIGSLEDAGFLKTVFQGATAVYAMIPPHYTAEDIRAYQNVIGQNIAQAAEANGVKYAITLSSLGAQLGNGAGVVDGVADLEKYFNKIEGLHVIHLRPAFFMENFYGQIGLIKQANIVGFSAIKDIRVPMIHTQDIAEVATALFLGLNFTGQSVRYILGERDLSFEEATQILGKAIGKPELPYVQFSYEDSENGMIQNMGVSASLAKGYSQLFRCMNEGKMVEGVERTVENTSKTTFEQFAQEFAYVFQQG
jgi:uncharacterized protein YbjT (DUF2867 family)